MIHEVNNNSFNKNNINMVSTIQVPSKPKVPTVVSQILSIEMGCKSRVPINKRPYVSSLISANIKYKYPDRAYTLSIDTEDSKYLIIERLK